ncbi:hypothetical protein B0J13DRAFT_520834 [Dactylonectria estremocensis]|uniref:Uncharacterized protein n=1 Tax=Dactylonectria estremocensis TaxID=1079267 RepID=A0A9P9FCP1_9HYPO|nr:hypothetical protein B0J13DRAFT_520834 [Dactylonectria estremocensis]
MVHNFGVQDVHLIRSSRPGYVPGCNPRNGQESFLTVRMNATSDRHVAMQGGMVASGSPMLDDGKADDVGGQGGRRAIADDCICMFVRSTTSCNWIRPPTLHAAALGRCQLRLPPRIKDTYLAVVDGRSGVDAGGKRHASELAARVRDFEDAAWWFAKGAFFTQSRESQISKWDEAGGLLCSCGMDSTHGCPSSASAQALRADGGRDHRACQ